MILRKEDDAFARRVNRDGATDSICKYCYDTICTSVWETELERAEHSHVCDPVRIAKWKRLEEQDLKSH